jgi:hypothetical protein
LCNITWKICHQLLISVEVRGCGWPNMFFTSSKLNLGVQVRPYSSSSSCVRVCDHCRQ